MAAEVLPHLAREVPRVDRLLHEAVAADGKLVSRSPSAVIATNSARP